MAVAQLERTVQADWSAGMFRLRARDEIPGNGAYDLENCLLGDDHQAERRGGTRYLTGAAFGAGLTFLWDGTLGGARRTLVAHESAFGLLSGDDSSVASLGGAGLRFPVRPAVLADKLYLPGGVTFDGTRLGTATKAADVYAAAGGRLIACQGDQAFMSARDNATSFASDDFHRLPGGVRIIGAEGARDRAALFTTGGVWLISNVELDLTDEFGNVQQGLDLFSGDLVLWGESGIASYAGGIVAPMLDGVWELSVASNEVTAPPPLRKLSGPIERLYTEYVRLGYRPGGAAVHRGHYFLPILSGAQVVDLLVCRLDRGAWTRFTGHGARVSSLAVRVVTGAQQPVLLGAQRDASARLSRLRYFEPDQARTDADGTAGRWSVVTRDYTAGVPQTASQHRKVRIEYMLEDPGSTNPTISAGYATDDLRSFAGLPVWGGTTWGGATWESTDDAFTALTGSAPEDASGAAPFAWPLSARAERIRFRLRCTVPSGRASIRSLTLFSRTTGKT